MFATAKASIGSRQPWVLTALQESKFDQPPQQFHGCRAAVAAAAFWLGSGVSFPFHSVQKFKTLNELHVLISILHCPENNVTPRTHRWGHPTDVYYVGNVIASATCTQWCDLQIGARPGSSVMDHVDVGLWCWNWRKFVFFCTPPLDKCLFQFQELTHQVFNFPTQHRQNFRQQLFGCHRRSYQSSCIDSQFVKREFTCIFFHGLAIPWRCAVLACSMQSLLAQFGVV